MKGFVTIIAASALLSASLVAGLAATDQARPKAVKSGKAEPALAQASWAAPTAATASQAVSPTTWVDPPAKPACRGSAWPYRSTLCATADDAQAPNAPARKVRVIPADGRPADGSTNPAALALR